MKRKLIIDLGIGSTRNNSEIAVKLEPDNYEIVPIIEVKEEPNDEMMPHKLYKHSSSDSLDSPKENQLMIDESATLHQTVDSNEDDELPFDLDSLLKGLVYQHIIDDKERPDAVWVTGLPQHDFCLLADVTRRLEVYGSGLFKMIRVKEDVPASVPPTYSTLLFCSDMSKRISTPTISSVSSSKLQCVVNAAPRNTSSTVFAITPATSRITPVLHPPAPKEIKKVYTKSFTVPAILRRNRYPVPFAPPFNPAAALIKFSMTTAAVSKAKDMKDRMQTYQSSLMRPTGFTQRAPNVLFRPRPR